MSLSFQKTSGSVFCFPSNCSRLHTTDCASFIHLLNTYLQVQYKPGSVFVSRCSATHLMHKGPASLSFPSRGEDRQQTGKHIHNIIVPNRHSSKKKRSEQLEPKCWLGGWSGWDVEREEDQPCRDHGSPSDARVWVPKAAGTPLLSEWRSSDGQGRWKATERHSERPSPPQGTSVMNHYQFLQMSTEFGATAIPWTISYPAVPW